MQGNHSRSEVLERQVRQKLKRAQKLVFQRKSTGMGLKCATSSFLIPGHSPVPLTFEKIIVGKTAGWITFVRTRPQNKNYGKLILEIALLADIFYGESFFQVCLNFA